MKSIQSVSSTLIREGSIRRALVGVLAISLLVRLVLAFALGDHPGQMYGADDQATYDTLAQRVVAGYGFSFPRFWYPFTPANSPTAHWSFLYTLYLAGVYAIFGHHPLAARVIQVLLSGFNIWLAYRLGRRLFNDTAGLAAAALTALYAYFIFFNAALMTQTFYILTVLAALDLSLSLAKKPTRRGWILLGLVIGAGVLLRQSLLLFTPILVAWLWWYDRHSPQVTGHKSHNSGSLTSVAHSGWVRRDGVLPFLISGPLLTFAIIALVILPWTLRNYVTYHDFLLLNSNGGFWFYSSNHPNQGTNFDQTYVAPIPRNLSGLAEPALDRALYHEAVGFILADPRRFLVLSLNRTKDYFWVLPSDNSSLMSNLSRVFSFTLYLPFMLYGLFLSGRQWRTCLPMYLYVAFDAAFCLISWSAPRYRLPSDAVLMPFAGLAVANLVTALQQSLSRTSRAQTRLPD